MPADPLARERELTGTDHQEVGLAFAYDWNLPPSLATTLRDHHVPQTGTLSAVIAAADALVAEVHHPSAEGPEAATAVSDAALGTIVVTRESWEAIAPQVRADYAELLTVFERFGS